MKRSIVVLSILLLLVAAIVQAQITIGIDNATSGPMAAIGTEFKNALQFAPSVMGGQKVNYVILDDRSDPTTAVQNVKRMISENNIDVLIGPPGSPLSLAVIDTVAEAKVPMLSLASASAIVSPMDEKRRWVFKAVANDDVFVAAMLNHMLKHGIKTISMMAVSDPLGDAWVQATRKIAGEKGVQIQTIERFERTDTSTTPQALRVIKGNPGAVVIVAVGTVAVTPHRSLVEHGYKGKIYHSGGAASSDFLRLGGKLLDGAFVMQSPVVVAEELPDSHPIKKPAIEFLARYQAKFGTRSSSFGPQIWDEVKLVEAAVPVALKSARPGTLQFREALRTALENSKGIVGTTAVFTMSPTDHTGINEYGMAVTRVENQTWRLEDALVAK